MVWCFGLVFFLKRTLQSPFQSLYSILAKLIVKALPKSKHLACSVWSSLQMVSDRQLYQGVCISPSVSSPRGNTRVPGQFVQQHCCSSCSLSVRPDCCTQPAATLLRTWENSEMLHKAAACSFTESVWNKRFVVMNNHHKETTTGAYLQKTLSLSYAPKCPPCPSDESGSIVPVPPQVCKLRLRLFKKMIHAVVSSGTPQERETPAHSLFWKPGTLDCSKPSNTFITLTSI